MVSRWRKIKTAIQGRKTRSKTLPETSLLVTVVLVFGSVFPMPDLPILSFYGSAVLIYHCMYVCQAGTVDAIYASKHLHATQPLL